MPSRRESLESVKTRVVREQQARTDRRIRQLLQQDREVIDDSEEDNRLIGRRARGLGDATSPTDRSSKSCCCRVSIGVLVVVCLLCCLIFFIRDATKRMEE